MSKEIFLLFFINVCSAIGYSLIAPLYPLEAKEKGIQENLCGIVISMFAVSNFFATPFTPALIGKYGRKEMFYTACILEVNKLILIYDFVCKRPLALLYMDYLDILQTIIYF